jgi:hypothetical protein
MIDNNLVIIAIIVLVFLYIVFHVYSTPDFWNRGTENLNNTTETKTLLPSDHVIAVKVYEYIKSKDEDFPDYIQFLKNINNTNLKLINVQVFYELKTLKKYKNLNTQSILDIMTSN